MTTVERDILIGRIVDGEAGDAEWSALDRMAGEDPAVWRDLAQAHREQAVLTVAVRHALGAADDVELPLAGGPGAAGGRRGAVPVIGMWAGWAAAAAIGLAWIGGTDAGRFIGADAAGVHNGANAAGLVSIESVDDAVRAYLEMGRQSGQVVGELPSRVFLEPRPVETGGVTAYEVVYIRQFVERAVVTDFYRLQTDEGGHPVPLRVPPPRGLGETF